jgi:hypothetical protein
LPAIYDASSPKPETDGRRRDLGFRDQMKSTTTEDTGKNGGHGFVKVLKNVVLCPLFVFRVLCGSDFGICPY